MLPRFAQQRRWMGMTMSLMDKKLWICGTRADFITLAVRTGGDGYEGISLVVFPTDVKGLTIGKSIKKIGNKASDTAELFSRIVAFHGVT